MITTQDALNLGFKKTEYGTYEFKFGENEEYELVFEPLLFGDQMYVALYKNQELLTEKVVVKAGYVKE